MPVAVFPGVVHEHGCDALELGAGLAADAGDRRGGLRGKATEDAAGFADADRGRGRRDAGRRCRLGQV